MNRTNNDSVFLIGRETTRGTAATNLVRGGEATDINPSLTREIQTPRGIQKRTHRVIATKNTPSLSVTVNHQNGLLHSFLTDDGSITHTDNGSTHTHEYVFNPNGLISTATLVTGQKLTPELPAQMTLCMLETLTTTIEDEGVLTHEATFQASGFTTDISLPSYPTNNDGVITSEQMSFTLAGNTVEEAQSITFTTENNLLRGTGISTLNTNSMRNTGITTTFETEILVKNNNPLNLFLSGTTSPGAEQDTQPTGITVELTGSNGTLEYTQSLNQVVLTEVSQTMTLDEFTTYTVNGEGKLDTLTIIDTVPETNY